MDVGSRAPTVGALGDAGRQTAPAFAAFSTSCTSAVAEKVGMRALKSSGYFPHPSPLPEGEGIIRGFLIWLFLSNAVAQKFFIPWSESF